MIGLNDGLNEIIWSDELIVYYKIDSFVPKVFDVIELFEEVE